MKVIRVEHDEFELEDGGSESFEEEMAEDLISIISSYAGHIYGSRGGRSNA